MADVRILYVEDDEGLARLFQKALQPAGYQVDLAGDGGEGLALYKQNRYDVVAIDQRLPTYDGLELIRRMAEQGPLPPTIMVTGNGNEHIAVEAMKLGASDYVVKDGAGGYLALLPAIIKRVLYEHRIEQERQASLQALHKRNVDLAALNEVGQALTATLDLKEVIEKLLPAVTAILESEGAALWMQEEEALVCRAVYRDDVHHYEGDGPRLAPGTGVVGQVASEGGSRTVLHVPGEGQDADAGANAQLALPRRATLAVPLRVHGMTIGVLEVVNKTAGSFSSYDLALAEMLGASAAIAIDNARLVAALRAQNEELDAFAHTVAHDLKNPLNQVLGFSALLMEDVDTMPAAERDKLLQFINGGAHKMRGIINGLLLLAGVRKTEAECRPLQMGPIVEEALSRLASLISEYDAEVRVPETWPVALGYGPWLEEVWANYVSNAIKYGGRPPQVELGAQEREDGTIYFWVRDNGTGLSPAQQARLFAPFTRLRQVEAEGHGLGLSIVRRIIQKLGGEVGVKSEAGKGSLFFFTLPAASRQSPDNAQ